MPCTNMLESLAVNTSDSEVMQCDVNATAQNTTARVLVCCGISVRAFSV